MSQDVLRIEKLENGFEVEVYDEKISEANNKPKSNWESPWKGYAFSTAEEVVKFVASKLESLPKSSQEIYDSAFAEATKD